MNIDTLIPWTRKSGEAAAPADHPLTTVQREMDRMFDDLWRRWEPAIASNGSGGAFAWKPQADLVETPDAIKLSVELPGLDEKDVEVVTEGDRLIIRGEKRQDHEEKDEQTGWLVTERRWGRFQRVLPLGAGVDRDRIEATFSKGVLTVTLPKTEEARRETKRIEIKNSG